MSLAGLVVFVLIAAGAPARAGGDAAAPLPPDALHTQTIGEVTVRVGVPDKTQTAAIFGAPLLEKGIQPIWVEIKNGGKDPLWYLPITTDPTYFSPQEAAFRFADPLFPDANRARAALFDALRIPFRAAAGETISGFLLTHRETGLKALTIGMLRTGERLNVRFLVAVGGTREAVNLDRTVAGETLQEVDLAGLRQALAAMPCCARNRDNMSDGDPLNVVFIGSGADIALAMAGRGWRFAQELDMRTAIETAEAFVLRRDDPDSPVSPLYLFGRRQDMALQKARSTINERNHIRLWRTSLSYLGQTVWLGQISRDIGVELTTKSWYGTTHKIDPLVDLDRAYLLQDMVMSGAVAAFGEAPGVGVSPASHPRVNLEGDPYVTDGLRLVLVIRLDTTIPSAILGLDRAALQ